MGVTAVDIRSMKRCTVLLGFCATALLGACGGAGDPTSPTSFCGSPPPLAHPQLWLVYPMPSATAVPDNIGEVVFADVAGLTPGDSVAISGGGSAVPVGAFTPAPSPLPSPRVTPGAQFGPTVPYIAAPVPTLSPNTTYTVSFTYQDWANNPPSCSTTNTQNLGTFTTR